MQGFGTNEKEVIRVLANVPNPGAMAQLEQTYHQMFNRHLVNDIHSETSGYFREGLEAIVRGPLKQDAHVIHDAIAGAGTKETALDDVLLGRSNQDIHALKSEFQHIHHKSLDREVREDLSLKTQRLFEMVLGGQRADESAPVYPQQMEQDVAELYRATQGRVGTDQIAVCQIFSSRSDGQLRAISLEFKRRYQHPLSQVISREFSGHMKDALLRMLAIAEDKAKADAESLEEAMAGMGTKDRLLVNRLVRMHWNKQHFAQVKAAYRHFYGRDLGHRVAGETSRHYKDLMLAIVASA